MKKAIFLYDYTGIMAQPWLDAGYECYCFDGQHDDGVETIASGFGVLHKVGMWFDAFNIFNHCEEIFKLVGNGVEHVFGFPECTHLAVSGAAHFEKKLTENPLIQWEAMQLAHLVRLVGDKYQCPWAFENPVSVISTLWRKPDFTFNPYEYGGYLPVDDVHPHYPEYIKPRDAYPKKTCIWHGNGYKQPVFNPVECKPGYSDQHKKLGGKSLKTKNIRSATPRGFAMANFKYNSPFGCDK